MKNNEGPQLKSIEEICVLNQEVNRTPITFFYPKNQTNMLV